MRSYKAFKRTANGPAFIFALLEDDIRLDDNTSSKHIPQVIVQRYDSGKLIGFKMVVNADIFKTEFKSEGTVSVSDEAETKRIAGAIIESIKSQINNGALERCDFGHTKSGVTISLNGEVSLEKLASDIYSA